MELQAIPATAGMADCLYLMEKACFASPWSQENCAAEISMAQVLVLRYRNVPVGYASMSCNAEQAELRRLAVLPQYRGRGWGRILLTRILAEASQQGCHELLLEVAENNLPALKLYRNMGFKEYHRRLRYYSDGRAAICMRLLLRHP